MHAVAYTDKCLTADPIRCSYPSDGRRKLDTVPITTRQLEALIRLCQARAKACLRDFVLKEDALDVVELLSSSVEQVHSDEGGNLDRSRGGAGGKSNRKMKKAFVNEIQRIVGIGTECTLDDLVSTSACGRRATWPLYFFLTTFLRSGALLKE